MTWDEARGSYKFAERGLTNRFSGEKISAATVVATEGETTLASPEAGKQLTLYWIGMVSSEKNTAEVLATVKLAPATPYEWYLGAPGIFTHWEVIVGAENAKLVLKLSAAQKVAVNFTYTESFPGV